MLTPVFSLTQDAETVTVEIKAPYAKISDTEIYVEGAEFKFYSKPYFLRLNLPGAVVENGREIAKYDSECGTFTITLPKQQPGQVFDGLDMLTKLLAPSGGKSQTTQQPVIEVLDDTTPDFPSCLEEEDDEDEDFDWQIEQEPYKEDLDAIKLDEPKYGFANLKSGVLKRIQSECPDIIDLQEADGTSACDRRKLRLDAEQQQFDEEYYLFDLYQNDAIGPLLQYQPPWQQEYKAIKAGQEDDDVVEFTEKEREQMRKLPRKEYLLDTATTRKVYLSLVDIIFAYCYNHRTTEGENTVESGWTIAKLSGTLSWLDSYTSLRDALVTCYRRCLSYPLYRHWKLTQKVHRDMVKIFYIGRRRLLKCLLEIHDLMIHTDPKYILNDLYISDYCVWIQSASSKQLDSLVKELTRIHIEKKHLFFELDLLEHAAELAVLEDKEAKNVANAVRDLEIHGQTDRQSQLADQIRELSIQKGNSSEKECDGVKSALLQSSRAVTDPQTSTSEESDNSSSEYTTASEDGDSNKSSDDESTKTNTLDDDVCSHIVNGRGNKINSITVHDAKVSNASFEAGESENKPKPLIMEITDNFLSQKVQTKESSEQTVECSKGKTKCAMDKSSLNF